jgi:hypothetical protein
MVEFMMGNESNVLACGNNTFFLIAVNIIEIILWACFTIL